MNIQKVLVLSSALLASSQLLLGPNVETTPQRPPDPNELGYRAPLKMSRNPTAKKSSNKSSSRRLSFDGPDKKTTPTAEEFANFIEVINLPTKEYNTKLIYSIIIQVINATADKLRLPRPAIDWNEFYPLGPSFEYPTASDSDAAKIARINNVLVRAITTLLSGLSVNSIIDSRILGITIVVEMLKETAREDSFDPEKPLNHPLYKALIKLKQTYFADLLGTQHCPEVDWNQFKQIFDAMRSFDTDLTCKELVKKEIARLKSINSLHDADLLNF